MGIIVCKFGGSSLSSAEMFRRVLAIVGKSDARRCVVLSAPGVSATHPKKITQLLEACWAHRRDQGKVGPLLEEIAARYGAIADALGLPDVRSEARLAVRSALSISRAHTLSRGEYLCARLFSEYSGFPMLDASELVAFRADGTLDVPATLHRLKDALHAHPRLVVPGFYGADPDGRVVTLPRNGSDITGALAAAAARAELYENWTDVPGLLTADPDIVPEAQLIPRVSYRQMRRLAEAGAKVLHPDCLAPVEALGIPIRLCDTTHPERAGTLICADFQRVCPCVAVQRHIRHRAGSVARITAFGMNSAMASGVLNAFQPITLSEGADCFQALVPEALCEDCVRALHAKLL